MEPDRSRQLDPEMLEREEMPSASSTELQLLSPQSLLPYNQVPKWSLWCCYHVLHSYFNTDVTILNSGGTKILDEDQQQEDQHFGLEKTFSIDIQKIALFENENFQLLNFPEMNSNETLNRHLIVNPVNSRAISNNTENMISVKHKQICMFQHILMTSVHWTASGLSKLLVFLPSDKKTCNQHSIMSIIIRQTFHSQISILGLKDYFKKPVTFHEALRFVSNAERESSTHAVCAVGGMQNLLKYYHEKHKGRDKQYAFAHILLKNGIYTFFREVYPQHQNKTKNSASPSPENTKHSEEILIGQIDQFLQKHGTKAQRILIYTLNSPCLKREKDIVPCMFQLLDRAHQWYSKYGVFTHVAYTDFWGPSGPNYFKDLTFCNNPSPSRDFYPYIEKCEKIPFKLDGKDFRGNVLKSGIYETIKCVEATDRNKLKKDINSAVSDLMSLAGSPHLRKKHLENGETTITSFTFHPQVQDQISDILKENWRETVRNSFMSPVREEITTDFNSAVVRRFLKDLNSFPRNSRHLRLHRVVRTCE